jgi:hypothetical protein
MAAAKWYFLSLLTSPFFVLRRAAYRGTKQHYRDPGDILQPRHFKMELTTPRHPRRVGCQLYLLDTAALHTLTSIGSTVPDLSCLFEDINSLLRIC